MALKFLKVTLLIVFLVGIISTYTCESESTKFDSHLSKLLKRLGNNRQLVKIQSNNKRESYIYEKEKEAKKFIEDRTERAYDSLFKITLDLNNQIQQLLKKVIKNINLKDIQEVATLSYQLKNSVKHAKRIEKNYIQSQTEKGFLDKAIEKKNEIEKIERYIQKNSARLKFLEKASLYQETLAQLERNIFSLKLHFFTSQNTDLEGRDFWYDILGKNIRPD